MEKKKGYLLPSTKKGKQPAVSITKATAEDQQKTALEGHTDAPQQSMDECAEKIIQGWTTRNEGGEGNRGRGNDKMIDVIYSK